MAITLQLPVETEQRLRERAAREGKTMEGLLGSLAEQWADSHCATVQKLDPNDKPVEQWLAEFKEWVDSHKGQTAIADDSRESIYAGCGE